MRIRKSKAMWAAIALGVAAAAASVVVTIPAGAATSSCTAPFWYNPLSGPRQCTTGTVTANASGHYVDVDTFVCSDGSWKVWDINTGVTVASGRGDDPRSWSHRRIYGLYGIYQAKIWNDCASDRVSLDND